jgi:pentapeptide repeat protein
LAKCQFTTKYYDYERKSRIDYNCPDHEETLGSGLCIFHDENYLKEHKDIYKEHENKVRDKLMVKVRNSVDKKETLHCIGYHLPDNTIKETFTTSVYFSECEFQGKANFSGSSFQGQTDFSSAKFFRETNFESATFSGGTGFYSPNFSGAKYNPHQAAPGIY